MQTQKAKSVFLSLISLVSTASVISLSAVTMPLVTSQPAYAQESPKAIYGLIFDKWAQMGGSKSVVGNPTTDELPAARGGRYNEFERGYIYWHPDFGAQAVYGEIGKKWNEQGRENGVGYPLTSERAAANGGRFNEFQDGKYIYWHPSVGTFFVYGDIGKKWNSMGRERSRLGYPISDEQAVGSAGQRVSYFQGGAIYWNSGTRKITITYR
jgi:uncharacterized protein with LGFP repeats